MSALSVRITRTVAGLLVVMSMILTPASALAAPPETGETVHIVQPGETLSSIAIRYGVTVEALMAANDLADPNYVYVGQRLVVPGGSEAARYGGRHVVKVGETLTSVAFRYGTTAAALAAANGLRDADFIYVGQVLNVPGGSGSGVQTCAKAGDRATAIAPVNATCRRSSPVTSKLHRPIQCAGAAARTSSCTGQYSAPAQQPCTASCTGQYSAPTQPSCAPTTGTVAQPGCPTSAPPVNTVAPAPPPA